jgi:hypothetical protein
MTSSGSDRSGRSADPVLDTSVDALVTEEAAPHAAL